MQFLKEKQCRRGAWILGLWLAFGQGAHAVDLKGVNGCPALAAPAQIEVLPATIPNGNLELSTVDSRRYVGQTCDLQNVHYNGHFTIYKVWLHEGNNNIVFRVEPMAPANPDLVLFLVRDCNNLNTCVADSRDTGGPAAERLPYRNPGNYTAGFYYLFVDSISNTSGSYKLTVTGVNPTPDLVLDLTRSPEPAIAGKSLTYTMGVTNSGTLDATGVTVALDLPPGVTVLSGPGCTPVGRKPPCTITATIGNLPKGARQSPQVTVLINPAVRGGLTASAKVTSILGDPTPANNQQTVKTTVRAQSDLWIEMTPSVNPVVAGTPLTYALRVHNDGPSDATKVKVTDLLPGTVDFAPSPGCSPSGGGTVTCNISGIAAGAFATLSLNVNVKPSATGTIENTVQVTANENDPGPKPNSVTVATNVTRRTDLSIKKTGPSQVIAGNRLTYQIAVTNNGPSDSTGGAVEDRLPGGLTVEGSDWSPSTGTVTRTFGRIPLGGMVSLDLTARASSSLRAGSMTNMACVKPNENDQKSGNNCDSLATQVIVKSDLLLMEKATTGSVVAGDNLVYTLSVTNQGPSDSAGGTITDTLAGGLGFVSSPDDCPGGGTENVVICTVPSLPAGSSSPLFRFVVSVPSGFAGPTLLGNQLSFARQQPAEQGDVISQTANVDVTRSADLAVSLSASPSPVTAGGQLTYTLTVANLGPSDAAGVNVMFDLPGQADGPCSAGFPCQLGNLAAGSDPIQIHIKVQVPSDSTHTTITAGASVTSSTPDAVTGNNSVETTTALARPDDADLAVTKSAAVEAVTAGDLLSYTLAVTNHGPAAGQDVKVEDPLPPELSFVSATTECANCSCTVDNGTVIFDLGKVDANQSRQCTLTARVSPDFTGRSLENRARAQGTSQDPDSSNDESTATTPVLQLPPLVLPFFQVGKDADVATSLLAVRNPTQHQVGVKIDYFVAGARTAIASEFVCLARRQTLTRNLRNLGNLPDPTLLQGTSGHAGVTPVPLINCPLPDPAPVLSGDFIYVDSPALAGALPLVSTDTARLPPELCRRWSTRFLNDSSSAASTDFLFFVPGNKAGAGPVAVGKVYTEDGQFVQEVAVSSQEEAFRRTTRDDPANQIPLLAKFGSIEWELPPGVVGNIAAVHRAGGQYEVAVPGTCVGSASALVVPYFQVEPSGTTTLFAVRNESGA